MATVGNTSVQATTSTQAAGGLHVFGPYTVPAGGGTITSQSSYLDGLQAGSSHDMDYRTVIFADNGNTPVGGALIAWAAGTVVQGSAATWRTLTESGTLTGGSQIWVGIQTSDANAGDCCTDIFYDAGSGSGVMQTIAAAVAFGAAPPSTFPAATFGPAGDNFFSFYITYTPSVVATGAFQFRVLRREQITKRRSGLLVPDRTIWLPHPEIPVGA